MARELTAPTLLCGPDGLLNPDAVGWARRPLLRANLRGPWGRQKRWNYWYVTSPRLVIAMTIFDLDYLRAGSIYCLDRATGEAFETVIPFPAVALGDTSLDDAMLTSPLGSLAFVRDARGTRLRARSRRLRVDVLVERPPEHEILDLVVPLAGARFQHTSKHTALPASGVVVVDRVAHDVSGFAGLDFGRGVWPYRCAWNWGTAAGVVDGEVIGVNLGGQWTRGSGVTENALVSNGGKITRLDDEIVFTAGETWTLRSSEVDLRVTPEHRWKLGVQLGIAAARTSLVWGRFDGVVAGKRVDGLFGSAEAFSARW